MFTLLFLLSFPCVLLHLMLSIHNYFSVPCPCVYLRSFYASFLMYFLISSFLYRFPFPVLISFIPSFSCPSFLMNFFIACSLSIHLSFSRPYFHISFFPSFLMQFFLTFFLSIQISFSVLSLLLYCFPYFQIPLRTYSFHSSFLHTFSFPFLMFFLIISVLPFFLMCLFISFFLYTLHLAFLTDVYHYFLLCFFSYVLLHLILSSCTYSSHSSFLYRFLFHS